MKKINICDKEYPVDCNVLSYIKYRTFFKKDIFSDIKILQSFLLEQVLITKKLKEENPNVDDVTIISKLSGVMLDGIGDFIEASTRLAYIMIYTANKGIADYEEWLSTIPRINTNDLWIAEVTELAVDCFC